MNIKHLKLHNYFLSKLFIGGGVLIVHYSYWPRYGPKIIKSHLHFLRFFDLKDFFLTPEEIKPVIL